MIGKKSERIVGYKIELTLLDGTLKLEESGKVTADSNVMEEDLRKAEEDVRRSLERVYELVIRKVGSQSVRKTATKVSTGVSGMEQAVKKEELDLEGRWMLRIGEAAELVGVSRSKMYGLVASGQVPSVTLGSSRRIPVQAFREWMEKQITG